MNHISVHECIKPISIFSSGYYFYLMYLCEWIYLNVKWESGIFLVKPIQDIPYGQFKAHGKRDLWL